MSNRNVYIVDPEGFGCGILLGLIIRFWREILIVGAILFCVFLGTMNLQDFMAAQTANANATEGAQWGATLNAESTGTVIAQENATNVNATSTAEAQAANNYVSTLEIKSQLSFGPENGTIVHNPNDNSVASAKTNLELKNFIAEVQVHNPYDINYNPWSYAIDFRETHADYAYFLGVSSDSSWSLALDDGGNWSTISKGHLQNLDTSNNGSNKIRLIVFNDTAIFYLNDAFVSTINISGNSNSGDVMLTVGKEIQGAQTNYANFSVWNLSSESTPRPIVIPSATSLATSTASIPAGPYRANIMIYSALYGQAPLNVSLGAELLSANGDLLCNSRGNPNSNCSYTWNIIKADSSGNFGDTISISHSQYFGTSFDKGNYFITVNVCMGKACGGAEVYVSATK
ncbi:MAG: hypothetical protein M1282_09030 [Chloroflexi bacterium]|nr:hypothetical protein [Chloroflexota bacterium]